MVHKFGRDCQIEIRRTKQVLARVSGANFHSRVYRILCRCPCLLIIVSP